MTGIAFFDISVRAAAVGYFLLIASRTVSDKPAGLFIAGLRIRLVLAALWPLTTALRSGLVAGRDDRP